MNYIKNKINNLIDLAWAGIFWLAIQAGGSGFREKMADLQTKEKEYDNVVAE